MSGIVGILNRDGAPVEARLLHRMTEFLSFRGPDARECWSDGPVGFGHALLRTTEEARTEQQPWSLDGQLWITADARIDGRDELLAKLRTKVPGPLVGVPDAELILHAYRAWGEACLEHLIGDFAFAIWDGTQRRLFGARDHFGVKPFYYALLPHCLVFSNTLNCVRLHGDVSEALHPRLLDDFLLGTASSDPADTAYAEIHRLPAGHQIRWSESDGTVRIERFWTLPQEEPIRYTRASEYVDQFRSLLRQAVADRLRSRQVGVAMSGGLDSTTIAATARQVLAAGPAPFDLRAHTIVYDQLIPDRERHYAGLTARALGIPIHYLVADDYQPYEDWEQPELRRPEPADSPFRRLNVDFWKQIAAHHRVVLYGMGPDDLLRFPLRPHLAALYRERRFDRLLVDLVRYIAAHRGLPRRVWRTLQERRQAAKTNPPAAASRFEPAAPLTRGRSGGHGPGADRRVAEEALGSPFWSFVLEGYDPGIRLLPVEPRFPFFDLRLARYLLAIPPIPWCLNKTLLRRAMRGILPEAVRLRPKAPLAGSPLRIHLQQRAAPWIDQHEPTPELANYLAANGLSLRVEREDRTREQLRSFSLDLWLRQQNPVSLNR